MLDDRARRAVRTVPRRHGAERGVHVEEIVERQLLAVQLLELADAGLVRGVERRGLVRVLAVAKLLAPLERKRDPLGPTGGVLGEIGVNRGIVSSRVGERFRGELPLQPRC